ncbi:YkvA family protein [Aurantiacibacter spongiae]|uniref:DUF1232 domain-containing protein n=1 Tax=Aurantiacibacter spongiae TaxID=2488860 RepID=A0A3N5DST1_9SPHN|nr:YkvA family protein [Aurantiacibacter spongiae]RPF72331.1 DUF1232 domain-containing protein [Aurantiacibacter spongiae]
MDRLRRWARALKTEIGALWLAARDPRVPTAAKLLAGVVAAYALSPIDLIPDVIPVLGLLDDLLIVPAGIWLVRRMIPAPLLAELREQARERTAPRSLAGGGFVLAVWAAAAVAGWWYWWR